MSQPSASESQSASEKKPANPSGSTSPSGGGAVQMHAALRGHDFAAQEDMLRPVQRKRGAGVDAVQKKAVQLEGEGAPTPTPAADPAKKVAPPISYSVPGVVNIAAIADPVARNQVINQGYHGFDTAMTAYLGEPLVSNWCTYGQHASREAGAQIRNLQAAKTLLSDMAAHLADFTSIALSASGIRAAINIITNARSIARRAWNDIKIVVGLLGEEGLVKQSVLLWLQRAGIAQSELTSIVDRFGAIADIGITDISWGDIMGVYNTIKDTINLGIRLVTGIPGLITAMDLIYRNMVKGNREIYESVAPAYNSFLTAGLSGDGVVGGMGFNRDDGGFLAAAFAKYSNVRAKRNQLETMAADDPQRGTVRAARQAEAHQANLLVGYQEQLVILQPIFDTMGPELAAMSGTMVLRDPNGTHPLTNNWQDFYSRMGLDPAKSPPLSKISADNLATLAGYEARAGSISRYFEDNLTNKKIHNAPSDITPHGS